MSALQRANAKLIVPLLDRHEPSSSTHENNPWAEAMYRILGVDPGSLCTGYGIIEGGNDSFSHLASGVISLRKKDGKQEKLKTIFLEIENLIKKFSPTHFAIEKVFYSKNAKSTLVLGEARGAAIVAAALLDIPVYEYSAREVKQAVTGNGAADKLQVQYMLKKILSFRKPLESMDESDALAIALCHAFKSREWSHL
jgi:crossover junction endodeoxyribonuclease RuvC